MTNTKIIFEHIKKFDIDTLNSFKLFLKSPFFNTKKEMVVLMEHFKRCKSIDSKNLVKRAIFRKVCPKNAYSEIKADRFLSKFLKLIEQFVIHHNLINNDAQQKIQLMNYCSKNELYDQFQLLQKNAETLIHKNLIKNEDDNHMLYQIHFKKYSFLAITNDRIKFYQEQKSELQNAIKSIDKYYIIQKLRLITYFLNLGTTIKNEIDVGLHNEILEHVKNNEFSDSPLINAYYNVIMFLKDQSNESNYNNLIIILQENVFTQFRDHEKLLYDSALNYCSLKINTGNIAYYQKMFELYKLALKTDSFYIDGYIFIMTIKNIFRIALRLGEFDWTHNFLNQYQSKFKPNERIDIYNFGMSELSFHRNKFDKTLELLDSINFKNLAKNFERDARILKIKINFEKSELIETENLLDAFYKQTNNTKNKVSEQTKMLYSNFISILKKLISIPKFEKEKLEKILVRILETQYLAERIWLEEKVKEKLGISHKKNPRTI